MLGRANDGAILDWRKEVGLRTGVWRRRGARVAARSARTAAVRYIVTVRGEGDKMGATVVDTGSDN